MHLYLWPGSSPSPHHKGKVVYSWKVNLRQPLFPQFQKDRGKAIFDLNREDP